MHLLSHMREWTRISSNTGTPGRCPIAHPKGLHAGVRAARRIQGLLFSGVQVAGHGKHPPQRTPSGVAATAPYSYVLPLSAGVKCIQ